MRWGLYVCQVQGVKGMGHGRYVGHVPEVTELPSKSHGKWPLLGEIYQGLTDLQQWSMLELLCILIGPTGNKQEW